MSSLFHFTRSSFFSDEVKDDQREKKCTKPNVKTSADIFFTGSSCCSRIFLARIVMMFVAFNKKSSLTVWLSFTDVCFSLFLLIKLRYDVHAK